MGQSWRQDIRTLYELSSAVEKEKGLGDAGWRLASSRWLNLGMSQKIWSKLWMCLARQSVRLISPSITLIPFGLTSTRTTTFSWAWLALAALTAMVPYSAIRCPPQLPRKRGFSFLGFP